MHIERLAPGVRALRAQARVSLFPIRDTRWGWSCEVRRGNFQATARDDGEYANAAIAESKAIDWAALQGARHAIVEMLGEERDMEELPDVPGDAVTATVATCAGIA